MMSVDDYNRSFVKYIPGDVKILLDGQIWARLRKIELIYSVKR